MSGELQSQRRGAEQCRAAEARGRMASDFAGAYGASLAPIADAASREGVRGVDDAERARAQGADRGAV